MSRPPTRRKFYHLSKAAHWEICFTPSLIAHKRLLPHQSLVVRNPHSLAWMGFWLTFGQEEVCFQSELGSGSATTASQPWSDRAVPHSQQVIPSILVSTLPFLEQKSIPAMWYALENPFPSTLEWQWYSILAAVEWQRYPSPPELER